MNDANNLVDQYLALWNETDADRRRALMGRVWAEDASYVDPMMQGCGHAAIDALVAGVQQRFPGARFTLAGKPDAHNYRLRFSWALADGEQDIARGTDFGELSTDGKLLGVTGFFDYVRT